MKKSLLILAALPVLGLAACSGSGKSAVVQRPESLNETVTSYYDELILIGPANREGLQQEPHRYWFDPEYEAYVPEPAIVASLAAPLNRTELLVFIGTWCSDSQREVPRLYKILDTAGYPDSQLRLIGVDDHPNRYNQSPGGETRQWGIEYVPTIIVLQGGKERGRIVEYPEDTLEKDLLGLLARE